MSLPGVGGEGAAIPKPLVGQERLLHSGKRALDREGDEEFSRRMRMEAVAGLGVIA